MSRTPAARDAAWAFAVGLASARVLSGAIQVVSPGSFLAVLAHRGQDTSGARLGFRMKGGRDLALGLVTLAAAARDDASVVRATTAAAVVVDGIDGWAVERDAGATLRVPVPQAGAWLGYAVAALAAVAVAVLPAGTGRLATR